MIALPEAFAGSQPVPRRLSEILLDFEAGVGPRISIGDLLEGLRDRSFAPLMVLFAVPNVFLLVPGSSALTGLPLMIIALQLIAGREAVWLPRLLNQRSIDQAVFARIVRHAVPWVTRIERLARPRLWPGAVPGIERLVGLSALVMALLLFLPIPFGNAAPALAIIGLALAISERDGVWLMAGFIASALAALFVAAILGGGLFALSQIFG